MDAILKGRTAVVTGSTSGIGLGVATALARAGAKVMLNGFGDPKEIDSLRRRLEQDSGATVAYHPADLSQPAQAVQLIEDAEGALGRVDILVNNAGVQHVSPIESFPPEKWDLILALNLSSSFHTIRAALGGMRRRGWGRVINIASSHGLVASVDKAAYVAAKHGLIGLTKVVALETAREKLSVAEAKARLLGEKQPSLEFATPEQIGGLALFLCTDAAALSIDGGWTAQ